MFVVRSPLTYSEVAGEWFDPISAVHHQAALTNISTSFEVPWLGTYKRGNLALAAPRSSPLFNHYLHTCRKRAVLNTQDNAVVFHQKPKDIAQGTLPLESREEVSPRHQIQGALYLIY
jgi:hypothetical protein